MRWGNYEHSHCSGPDTKKSCVKISYTCLKHFFIGLAPGFKKNILPKFSVWWEPFVLATASPGCGNGQKTSWHRIWKSEITIHSYTMVKLKRKTIRLFSTKQLSNTTKPFSMAGHACTLYKTFIEKVYLIISPEILSLEVHVDVGHLRHRRRRRWRRVDRDDKLNENVEPTIFGHIFLYFFLVQILCVNTQLNQF